MLVSFFRSSIPLYIGKNPVEILCKVFEMELIMYTPVSLKFIFEKIKFKVLHCIQHNFICQCPGLSKDGNTERSYVSHQAISNNLYKDQV